MKIITSFVSLFFIVQIMYGQGNWTSPVQITSGTGEDTHPATVNSDVRIFSTEDWMAFTRFNYVASNICAVNTRNDATRWNDTLYYITDDSANNISPSLARAYYGMNDNRMMIVWQRNADLFFRCKPADVWLPQQALTHDSLLNNSPDVAPCDTGFGLVWERNGRILFSEFHNENWSVPIVISPDGDSNNFSPKLTFSNWQNIPFIVWINKNLYDSSHTIMYRFRKDIGWSTPRTLTSEGDNDHPFLARHNWSSSIFLNWESNRTGNWDIYNLSGSINADSLYINEPATNLTMTTDVDEHNCSFLCIGIITQSLFKRGQYFFPNVAVWKSRKDVTDDIILSRYGFNDTIHYTISPALKDRGPIISSGIRLGNIIRVWAVWENDSAEQSKLYGSRTDIFLDDVSEGQQPSSYILYQNYPNPANPQTKIRYFAPYESQVELTVYNILGQTIKVLVDDVQEAGYQSITFDATSLSTGIYFYKLTAMALHQNIYRSSNNGMHFTDIKKLVIVK